MFIHNIGKYDNSEKIVEVIPTFNLNKLQVIGSTPGKAASGTNKKLLNIALSDR